MDATTTNSVSGIGGREVSALVDSSMGKAITRQSPMASPVEDTVGLSPAGMALSRGGVRSPPRYDRVYETRTAIKAETFETPERVNETVKRLLSVIG
ncbi:MAG: hypothetical protein JXQ75_10895 [Phycisphaerae bacterium]|nr:hypothetical protein [Phycisphaerae bacterium]